MSSSLKDETTAMEFVQAVGYEYDYRPCSRSVITPRSAPQW
jgi:hypothetical protein